MNVSGCCLALSMTLLAVLVGQAGEKQPSPDRSPVDLVLAEGDALAEHLQRHYPLAGLGPEAISALDFHELLEGLEPPSRLAG